MCSFDTIIYLLTDYLRNSVNYLYYFPKNISFIIMIQNAVLDLRVITQIEAQLGRKSIAFNFAYY